MWKTFFGDIPRGQLVMFIDGDPLSCHPDNLRLISRQQNMPRNWNPLKAAQTMKQLYAENRVNNPSRWLRDEFVLRTVSRDPIVQEHIRTQVPVLIRLKRELLLLKRNKKSNSSVNDLLR
ncbi:MAG: HNH endonuclease [Bacteroidetes bacterium]|nr:HNH endonuclease [Fibrella sp.]